MANIQVRGLAAKGILRDPAPYELDPDAWSGGMNVRFHANRAERSPGFRGIYDPLSSAPTFLAGFEDPTGADLIIVHDVNGRLWTYVPDSPIADISEAGHTNSTDPRAVTATTLGEVHYINRPDGPPRYFSPGAVGFATLPNMDSAWTCRSLRAWGDYVVALNVTKPATWVDPHTGLTIAGGLFPNMFKWSDLTLIGQTPPSWDADDPNTSAGENPLEELKTPIVDGLPMRSNFMVYSEDEIWGVEQIEGVEIFQFDRVFSSGGLIAPNCVVEVDGVHYCFGRYDIYRHDGVTKQSIIDKRNRDSVYRFLDRSKAESFFVSYLPHLSSVFFCYSTMDPEAAFQGVGNCNQAAVYDIAGDTWAFIDLPSVCPGLSMVSLNPVWDYSTVPTYITYANVGGAYVDQEDLKKKTAVCASAASGSLLTASRLLGYDFINKGQLALPLVPECNAPAYLERIGLDLDQLGDPLGDYKLVRRVFPLVVAYQNVPVQIQVGGALTPAGLPSYQPPVPFNPSTSYKVDVIKGGRYLAIRITVPSAVDFEIAGYDLDVVPNGKR